MYPETIEIVRSHMTIIEPITPDELVEKTGLSRSTIYNVLSVLKAERHHVGKNLYGFTLPDEEIHTEIDTPGQIEDLSWAQYTSYAIDYVRKVHLQGNPTPESYVEGFQQIADTFQKIADHVRAVQHRPDWRLVLGLDKEQ